MRRKIEFVLSLALLSTLSFGTLHAGQKSAAEQDKRTLTVQGEGKVQAVPDIATLSVEVSQEGEDLDLVTGEVRRQMGKVLEAVKAQAIEDKDIQTQLYNVRPKWEYDKRSNPHRAGYTVTNRITVKVRDLKKVGKVLAAVIKSGATTVNGPDFEVDNRKVFERKALAAAYDDAHAKAAALAEAAGVKLGAIFSMNPGQIGWPMPGRPFMARGMAMAAAAPAEEPIAAGEQTLSATVTVVYELD